MISLNGWWHGGDTRTHLGWVWILILHPRWVSRHEMGIICEIGFGFRGCKNRPRPAPLICLISRIDTPSMTQLFDETNKPFLQIKLLLRLIALLINTHSVTHQEMTFIPVLVKQADTHVFRCGPYGTHCCMNPFVERNNQEESVFEMLQAIWKHSKIMSNLHQSNQAQTACLVCLSYVVKGERLMFCYIRDKKNQEWWWRDDNLMWSFTRIRSWLSLTASLFWTGKYFCRDRVGLSFGAVKWAWGTTKEQWWSCKVSTIMSKSVND